MEFFKGISRMMGFDEEDDEELLENREENYDEGEEEIEIEPFVSKKQNKIVNIHTASS